MMTHYPPTTNTGDPYAVSDPLTHDHRPLPAAAVAAYDQTGDGTGGLIPYKNPCALTAYYLGIVALLPIIGIPFGMASVVLGIMGLKARARNPIVKGSVHAWIGIVLGAGSILVYGALIALLIGSAFVA